MFVVAQNLTLPVAPLVVLSLVFGASLLMFAVLARRWTSHRLCVELQDWSRESGYHLARTENAQVPPPLSQLTKLSPRVRWMLSNEDTSILQLETEPIAPAAGSSKEAVGRWHVLVRATRSSWIPTGLRPTNQSSSLLDLFSLSSFPSARGTDRFTVYGSESIESRRLGDSPAAALLPPDLGLLLHGEHLLIDFSARPFDPIEFGRVIALADQLARVG